jgi:hypothetical protein
MIDMNKYTIFFEMFDRKMKTTIEAFDESHAKRLLCERIIYHKIVLTEDNDITEDPEDVPNQIMNNPTLENLMDIFGMNDTKPRKNKRT